MNRPLVLRAKASVTWFVLLVFQVACSDDGSPDQDYIPAEGERLELIGYTSLHPTLDMVVQGSYAYLLVWIDEQPRLAVVGISMPDNPREVGSCEISVSWESNQWLAVSGDYAYISAEYGLQVVDISTPADTREVGFCDTMGNVLGMAVAGDYAYVVEENGLSVVDISTPANPMEVGFYDSSLSTGFR